MSRNYRQKNWRLHHHGGQTHTQQQQKQEVTDDQKPNQQIQKSEQKGSTEAEIMDAQEETVTKKLTVCRNIHVNYGLKPPLAKGGEPPQG